VTLNAPPPNGAEVGLLCAAEREALGGRRWHKAGMFIEMVVCKPCTITG